MITVLAGGVGGAKFLQGLAQILPAEEIVAVVNTGDDVKLYGLHISPDLDTVTYTLAGKVDQGQGWGVAGDTFHCLESLSGLNAETWFQLGDRDLATHILRTWWLGRGMTLAEVTAQIGAAWGVRARILPMTNDYVPTWVLTREGEMHFQEYFVRRRAEPEVLGLRFADIQAAQPAPGVLGAIENAEAVIIAPSNPFISIGPILAVPGIRSAIQKTRAAVAAVSPIIEGRALKGPAAKMLLELGHEVSAAGAARIYQDIADIFVLDRCDVALEQDILKLGMKVTVTNTIMRTPQDKRELGARVLNAVAQ